LLSPEKTAEKAILIGLHHSRPQKETVSFWNELEELAGTAGATVVGTMIQPRDNPDPALFLGSGKAEELATQVKELAADIVIAAQDLSATQVRNLSDVVGVKVIDRTGLILDIFAQRAQTREGKLQVELAQLNYILPRVGNSDLKYSRMGGGIGTRGPGETKLEVDRRHLRQRIADLKRELLEVETHRIIQRQQREKNQILTVALVGYTNAGKSTLFNRLTQAGVPAEGRLFDTLDPVSHLIKLPDRREVLILDTVGFISDLPHQLVAAFKATLEETIRASVLIHVMDACSSNLMAQFTAVRSVLAELKIETKEMINVLNKVDLLDSENTIQRLAKQWEALPVSAKYDLGIVDLIQGLQKKLAASFTACHVLLPFSEAALLDLLHRKGRVLEEVFTADGIRLLVELEEPLRNKLQSFVVADNS
jgi:GTPase